MRILTIKCSIAALIVAVITVTSAAAQDARLLDEFGDFCCESFRARMDNFFTELLSRPSEKGVAIFYGGRSHPICAKNRSPKRGEIELIMKTFENHMKLRGIHRERIEIKFGGFREAWGAEFWAAPQVGVAPHPKQTVPESTVKFKSGRAKLLDLRCEP